MGAFGRDVVTEWSNRNPGPEQRKVSAREVGTRCGLVRMSRARVEAESHSPAILSSEV